MKHTLNHITQENGKWSAEVSVHNSDEIHVKENTEKLWGGMAYPSLKCMLKEYYNIELPKKNKLTLIKKTAAQKIYTVPNGL